MLAAHGPLRVGEPAARMNIAPSTTSRTVDLLDGCGRIARRPDPAGRRAGLISRNDDGAALLGTVRRETTGILAEEIAALTADRRRLLHAALPALPALEESAERMRGRTAPPAQPNGRAGMAI
ncbi:MarR family winged helix-turn-helix transcriptional regulator [Streptomyces sp. GS7]|uniref:MarR family winged helix-turn-helix transcriptional regulator n=1 Tax=Streptomyces sp. GS7 TaxID=2692234 RepID=UPI001F459E6F|nr:MarR family transcriptional regulator [Streptomyces sp. GS7]